MTRPARKMMSSAESAIPKYIIVAAIGFGVVAMVSDLDEEYFGLAAWQ